MRKAQGVLTLEEKIKQINDRIGEAARSCGRDPETVKLVAVSKTIPADRVLTAIQAGVTDLGENYIQESREKFNTLATHPVTWHFIGHLQSNKAKYAVRMFDLIHTVDKLKLAREIDKNAGKIDKIQDVLVQVNISEEATKSGVSEEGTLELVQEISRLPNLSLKGLMTMPPFFDQPEKARPYFKALVRLRDRILEQEIPNISLDELSMGMTGDFETAIQEGATLVRIGTAIFGERY